MQDGGGPPSGFVIGADVVQTGNVVASLPSEENYLLLWLVRGYDNDVSGLDSTVDANTLASGLANVSCPSVAVERTAMSTRTQQIKRTDGEKRGIGDE